ncbi:MAG: RDD family protein [Chitinophagia bacterium]|nr:RDD family protein [Chitinophagia bacterium]
MAIITINTPFNIDLEFKVATFGKRLAAWLIDIVVITIYFWIVNIAMGNWMHQVAVKLLVQILPVAWYQMLAEMSFNGQTVGKKLTHIKVMDKDGQEPVLWQYVIRWMLNIGNLFVCAIPGILLVAPWALAVLWVVYLPDAVVMLASFKSQRIGDLAAGTVVIESDYKPDISATIYQQIEVVQYTPVFPEVMRLSDRDINGIRNLIDNKYRKNSSGRTYKEQIVNKIKRVLQIESELDSDSFLRQLLRDYNYLTSRG